MRMHGKSEFILPTVIIITYPFLSETLIGLLESVAQSSIGGRGFEPSSPRSHCQNSICLLENYNIKTKKENLRFQEKV